MAITSTPADYAAPEVKLGPKVALAAFYILIGIVAMAVAVPAAFATFGAS
ncbi:hypothetical protein [Hyphococcus luteus]|jgi:hypothetical protein|nr:hypothetical protein [Marinicaulis flavus]